MGGLPSCPGGFTLCGDSFDALYIRGRYLGRGKFSQVYLCEHKYHEDRKYALKLIDLPDVNRALYENLVNREIEILQELRDCEHIVHLVDFRRGQREIKLVLDYCEGGELYERVKAQTRYSEEKTQKVIRNILEAVAFFHEKGIMHRDLKPENVLLVSKESDTDVKITDFGLAKLHRAKVPGQVNPLPRSSSTCGSDFYLAPELIRQEEYGKEIDMWSVGVITYVCLSGSLPFYSKELHKLYRSIIERDLTFPHYFSAGARNFISSLLAINPRDRLSARDALGHPWLRDLDPFTPPISPPLLTKEPQTPSDNFYPFSALSSLPFAQQQQQPMQSNTPQTTQLPASNNAITAATNAPPSCTSTSYAFPGLHSAFPYGQQQPHQQTVSGVSQQQQQPAAVPRFGTAAAAAVYTALPQTTQPQQLLAKGGTAAAGGNYSCSSAVFHQPAYAGAAQPGAPTPTTSGAASLASSAVHSQGGGVPAYTVPATMPAHGGMGVGWV